MSVLSVHSDPVYILVQSELFTEGLEQAKTIITDSGNELRYSLMFRLFIFLSCLICRSFIFFSRSSKSVFSISLLPHFLAFSICRASFLFPLQGLAGRASCRSSFILMPSSVNPSSMLSVKNSSKNTMAEECHKANQNDIQISLLMVLFRPDASCSL